MDQKYSNKRKESNKTTQKTGQTNIGRRWNYLYRWQDLCAKKQTTSR